MQEVNNIDKGWEISKQDFSVIAKYIKLLSGMDLKPEKEYLVRQRITPILIQLNIPSFADFADRIRKNHINWDVTEIIAAITINETSFFRDRDFYNVFKERLIPELLKSRLNHLSENERINILSAGCSKGQEIWSIAMLFYEHMEKIGQLEKLPFVLRIIGSDIDNNALNYARIAEYAGSEVARGLDNKRKAKFFTISDNKFKIIPALRKVTEFRNLSLHKSFSYNLKDLKFDLIFARNVLIYFDQFARADIMRQFAQILKPGGMVIFGASEIFYQAKDFFDTKVIDDFRFFVKR